MKIYAISDTHNKTCEWINNIPSDVDLIIHCGDISSSGDEYEVGNVLYAMNKIGKPIIMTAGNHDFIFEHGKSKIKEYKEEYENITILIDSYTIFNDIKIYGTPYVLTYNNWAFGEDKHKMEKHLPKEEIDILISHCPPSSNKLSMCGNIDIGNKALTSYLANSENSMLVLCGHNHLGKVIKEKIGKSIVFNVAESELVINYLK
ncbi:MAG: metallophosphoesterase family protein [Fusobacteriaceae bacterium]